MTLATHCRNIMVFFMKGKIIRYHIPLYKQIEKDATIVSCTLVDNELIIELESPKSLNTQHDVQSFYVSEEHHLG